MGTREDVETWQRAYGMEPRGDSRLTEKFVRGEVAWPADEVARELVCTDYLYQTTLYGELLEEYLRLVAARVNAMGVPWKATWKIVTFYGPLSLKCMCLDACGVRFPDLTSVSPASGCGPYRPEAPPAEESDRPEATRPVETRPRWSDE